MVPAQYAPVLKKLAEKKDDLKQERVDNVKIVDEEVRENLKDNKKSLEGLFGKAKDTSVAKLFPGKTKKVTSDPFLKVAFASSMNHVRFEKTAGEVGVMFLSFQDELNKIANMPTTSVPQVNKELGGFKSLAGHAGASGAGAGMASGFGKALGTAGKAVSALR